MRVPTKCNGGAGALLPVETAALLRGKRERLRVATSLLPRRLSDPVDAAKISSSAAATAATASGVPHAVLPIECRDVAAHARRSAATTTSSRTIHYKE